MAEAVNVHEEEKELLEANQVSRKLRCLIMCGQRRILTLRAWRGHFMCNWVHTLVQRSSKVPLSMDIFPDFTPLLWKIHGSCLGPKKTSFILSLIFWTSMCVQLLGVTLSGLRATEASPARQAYREGEAGRANRATMRSSTVPTRNRSSLLFIGLQGREESIVKKVEKIFQSRNEN